MMEELIRLVATVTTLPESSQMFVLAVMAVSVSMLALFVVSKAISNKRD